MRALSPAQAEQLVKLSIAAVSAWLGKSGRRRTFILASATNVSLWWRGPEAGGGKRGRRVANRARLGHDLERPKRQKRE